METLKRSVSMTLETRKRSVSMVWKHGLQFHIFGGIFSRQNPEQKLILCNIIQN